MAVKPRFYPILPYEKRGKRQHTVTNNDAKNNPTSYRKYRWYDVTNKTTKSTSRQILDDFSSVVGYNTQSVVKLPNWKQVVARGGNATNSYSREVTTIKPTRYSVKSENSTYVSTGSGSDDAGSLINQREWDTLRDQALARLKNKLNGHIGKAQLAAPLAESREIHSLVRQINGLTQEMLKAALAIKKTRGKSAAKFFGDVWLGYGFGVRPLISDLGNAAKAILEYQLREDHRVRVVGTASREYTSGQVILPVYQVCSGTKMGWHKNATHRQGVQIVAGIDLDIRSSASYGMSDQLGFSLGAVPGVLWELTPFSWVVDYAFTVGPWLDDMFYTVPGTVKYVSRSEKYQMETYGTPYAKFDPGWSGAFFGTQSVLRYVSFTRASLATLPTRSLRIKTADEVANYGLTKILNLASVLAQRKVPRK